MCSMTVLCPLCAQTSFTSIDALRNSLIKAANGPLACPICHELFLGLDKLTIHLFSHTSLVAAEPPPSAAAVAAAALPVVAKKSKSANGQPIGPQALMEPRAVTAEQRPMMSPQPRQRAGEAESGDLASIAKNDKKPRKLKAARNSPAARTEAATRASQDAKDFAQMEASDSAAFEAPAPMQPPGLLQPSFDSAPSSSFLATCDVCEFTFRTEQLRDMHFRLVHQNSPLPVVHQRPINLPPQPNANQQQLLSAAQVQIQQPQNEFKCHLCSKTFKMKGSLRVHLKVVHMMGVSRASTSTKLNICDRIRHKENKVQRGGPQPQQPQQQLQQLCAPLMEQPQIPPALGEAKSLRPAVNNELPMASMAMMQPTMNNGNLMQFSHSNSGIILNINENGEIVPTSHNGGAVNQGNNVLLVFAPQNAEFDKDAAGAPVRINNPDNPKIWECDVCSKSFTTKYFLKKHKRLHTGEMPYTCEICARTFTFQQSYHKHLLYHSDEKPHVCKECGRAFKELSTLHNHERIHSGEKPFNCEVCGKCFRQRVSFLVHTRIHTGAMPYNCEQCDKSFRYKVSLRTHKCISSNEGSCETSTCGSLQGSGPAQVSVSLLGADSAQNLSPASTNEQQNTLEKVGHPSPASNNNNSVDEASEKFIKAFLESAAAAQSSLHAEQHSPASVEIAELTSLMGNISKNSSQKHVEEMLSKTIDEIVVESCNKMGIGSNSFNTMMPQTYNEGSTSPLQKLQEMRLYSPNSDIQNNGNNHNNSNNMEENNNNRNFTQFSGNNLLDSTNNMHL